MLPAHRLSIRTRLALIYTALLAAALVVFGAGVFLALREELTRSFDTTLVANAEHAAGAFAQDVDASGALRPTARLVDQFASTGGRILILDPAGDILADSAPAGSENLGIGPADLSAADHHTGSVLETSSGGDVLRVTVAPIRSADGRALGYVVWADSTRPLRELLANVTVALLLAGLAMIGLALVGGLVLARRALAPVAELTEAARAISLSGDFAARVDAGPPGDEVGDLALAFNEMLVALEQNHQALQQFLGDASHQLRTPLTSIRANLELAQRPGLADDERRALFADAHDETERMGRLVHDLLSLARAESGARLEFAPVELDALVVDAVRRQRQAARHVRMGVADVEPAIVDGDHDRLLELFGILLDNAARYTREGGRVTVRLETRDGRARVTVEDTGIGIDPEDRAHLFERLYRGARARELRPSGTGLGLAIAHWIVDAHGGSIELSDRPGGGTVATISLPLRSDPGRPAGAPSSG